MQVCLNSCLHPLYRLARICPRLSPQICSTQTPFFHLCTIRPPPVSLPGIHSPLIDRSQYPSSRPPPIHSSARYIHPFSNKNELAHKPEREREREGQGDGFSRFVMQPKRCVFDCSSRDFVPICICHLSKPALSTRYCSVAPAWNHPEPRPLS